MNLDFSLAWLRKIGAAALLVLLLTLVSSAAAHEVGGKGLPNQGRIVGKPDVIKIGDLTFRFLPAHEEYEIREPGKPVSYMHADYPTPMSAASGGGAPPAYGAFTKMPAELQDDPVCRTSGHRVIPVWTHRPGQPPLDASKTSFIRSMIKRMNWKVLNQTAGTSRELQMAVDCNGAGEINVIDLTTADRTPTTVFATMKAQLGDPQDAESVKYFAFDYESDPGASGYGRVYSGTGKFTTNPNNYFTSYAVVYAPAHESYATVHELLHTMGASQGALDENQPYSNTGLHCVDGVDILCYADGSTSIWGAYSETRCPIAENDAVNDPIDCGKDTYFNPVPGEGSWLATHWNVAGPENGLLVAKPKVTRLAPISITQTSATIRNLVHPEGAPTKYRFEYGPTKAYGSTWPAPDAFVSGTAAAVTVTRALTGLEPESIYHYRVVATSDGGTVYGQDEVFTTKAYTPILLGVFGGSGSGSGELDNPGGITVDGEGDVWVADRDNNRVVQFNRQGEYLSSIGSAGSGNGQFNLPEGVAIGSGGKVFVADTGNKRVQYFTAAGSYLGQFGTTELQKLKEPLAIESTGGSLWVADASAKNMKKYSEAPDAFGNYLQTVIGGEALLTHPNGFGIDSGGDLWIADSGSDGIEVLHSFGLGKSGFDAPAGNGDGEVQNPFDVAFKATGSIFVADTGNNRIQQFSTATSPEAPWEDRAELVAKFGVKGSGEGQFLEPRGVAVGPNGTVYVSDSGNSRVQRWGQRAKPEAQTNAATSVQGFGATLNGTVGPGGLSTSYHFEYGPTTSYGTSAPVPDASIEAGVEPAAVSKAVTGLQQDTLYHYRLVATNAEGISYGKDQTFLTTPVYSHLSTIGSLGTGNGQFKRPLGMATDASGNVWVADRENNRLQKFNSEGEYLTQIGTKGSALGQFNDPRGVAIDSEGNLWVTEAGNQRIQKLSPGGTGLLQIKESLLGNPRLATPSGITIGGDGNIYVTDQGKQNVQKYSPTPGTFGNRHLISWSGFLNPTQMATDPQGDVWFVEFQEASVYEVGSNYLVPEKRFGTKGSGAGQLLEPYGIAIKSSGNILITERGNNRVEQFSPAGTYLTQFGAKGTGTGQFTEPTGITTTSGGLVFVSDAGNNRVQRWEVK